MAQEVVTYNIHIIDWFLGMVCGTDGLSVSLQRGMVPEG